MYNFGLSEDQRALTDSVRRYAEEKCGIAKLRQFFDARQKFSAELWKGLAELGVPGLCIPAEYGGSGLGSVDAMATAETLGRAVLPLPLLENTVASFLIVHHGSEEFKAKYLAKLASGACVATLAIDEKLSFWSAGGIACAAVKEGGSFRLTGLKTNVAFANTSELIIVAVRTGQRGGADEGITLLTLERPETGWATLPVHGVDDTYEVYDLVLDELQATEAAMIGAENAGWTIWQDAMRLANLLASAEMLGCVEKSMEMIVAYSKDRTQFGKPIGSYQAMKHRCADILIDLEAARGTLYYAAWVFSKTPEDSDLSVSSAKAFAADAAVRCLEKVVQSYGAIGFTWEMEIHFYLKRAKRLEMSFGNGNYHRERIAALWL